MNRREFLKLSAAVGATAFCGLGLEPRSQAAPPAGLPPADDRGGQAVEARIDPASGNVQPNPEIIMRHSACLGCYSSCGNRVKIDKKTGQILRVYGNPYNPNNTEPHLAYNAPLAEAYLAFSTYKDKGHEGRSVLCGRGNATLQAHYDPMRLLTPLKRAGKRGENKWQPITWEQAVQETVEGGQLFQHVGEDRQVEGFRQVFDRKTPLDPSQPELGPKANQLVMCGGRGDGRTVFAGRFAGAFGTVNNYGHGSS